MSLLAEASIERPVLRYQGGKFRLASWLIGFFPPHRCYVESFGGGASVLLRKVRSEAEVYNDLDGDVVTFFRVVRDPVQRERLMERLALTPFSRAEFDQAYEPTADPIECGAQKNTTGFRMSAKDVLLWSRFPDAIAGVGTRLEGVLIEQRPAIDVMLQHDAPDTLHYVDPPYVFDTRDRASKHIHRYYRHEMSDWEHVQLLACLRNLRGMVVLSGYHSDLYDGHLVGWSSYSKQTSAGSNRGSTQRTEVVWLNTACQAAQ